MQKSFGAFLTLQIVPRKHSMPERERAICERLQQFRSLTGLSQSEFAASAGLEFNAYASYEYARSRLNYPAAWHILNAFRLLNPAWLAEGSGILFEIHFVSYPTPEQTGFGPRVPFSVVYDRCLKELLKTSKGVWMLWPGQPFPAFEMSTDIQGRLAARDIISQLVLDWLCAQPDSQVNGFLNDLLSQALLLLKKYPPDMKLKTPRSLEMFKAAAKRRILFAGQPGAKNNPLTDVTVTDNIRPVKSPMANLLGRLNKATSQRGMKSKLAKVMGVPLANVSQWLSGDREPGGETTLRLLHWVEQAEAQPKESPGSASTQPGQKTQVRKSVYEKANPSPQK